MTPTIHRYTNKPDWLAGRYGVGASESASVLGMGMYSALDIYAEKKGYPRQFTAEQLAWMRHGKEDEPAIAEWFEEEAGIKLHNLGEFTILRDAVDPWLFCTLDRDASHGAGPTFIPAELKSPRQNLAVWEGKDPPTEYWVQLQQQIHICRAPYGYLVARTCPERYWKVEADPWFARVALPQLRRFWLNVEADIPPAPDGSESARDALNRMHPDAVGHIDLPEFVGVADSLGALKDARDKADKLYEQKRQSILQAMGNHATATVGSHTFRRTIVTPQPKVHVNYEMRQALQIAAIRHTITEGKPYVRFTEKGES